MGQGYIAQYGNDPTNGQHYWVKGENKMFEYDYHTSFSRDFTSSVWHSSETVTTHNIHGYTISISTWRAGSDDAFYLTVTLDNQTVINTQGIYMNYLNTIYIKENKLIYCDLNNNKVYFIEFDNEFLYYYDTPEILTSTDPNKYQENIIPPSYLGGDYIKKIF